MIHMILRIMKIWLPIAIATTLVTGTAYTIVQQSLRLGLNDPQIQMAEDIATELTEGKSYNDVLPVGNVDMAKSLAPYIIIYDSEGTPVAANVTLNGKIPAIPAGVFDYTRQKGEDRISWQPEPNVRSAVIMVAINGGNDGFVLAGRNMREVEIREDQTLKLAILGGVVTLFLTLFIVTLLEVVISPRLTNQ